MNVASLELCKELYELSEWHDTNEYGYYKNDNSGDYAIQYQVNKEATPGNWWYEGINAWPTYDLGYLLRKLQIIEGTDSLTNKSFSKKVTLNFIGKDFRGSSTWQCGYKGYVHQYGDTPEDAAAKLAIELHRQGVLRPNSELNSELGRSKPSNKERKI